MLYEEIESYDIINKPEKVSCILTDNANHFNNDLYILSEGRHFPFDKISLNALKSLKNRIEKILDETKI